MELWADCKWPYKWVTGVITALTGVITFINPFITGIGGPPCMMKFHPESRFMCLSSVSTIIRECLFASVFEG